MKKYNYIIGSGLVALIAQKILGGNWKIIPFSSSRFYAKGVPALGDDFIIYDQSVLEIVKEWGFTNYTPLFYKRPFSVSGSLLYNNMFSDRYFDRIGIDDNPLTKDYYKSDFTVFPFSCIQLWKGLLPESLDQIRGFYRQYENAKTIKHIADHEIILDSGDVIEYENVISTVPYDALTDMLKIPNTSKFSDSYYYHIRDDGIDIENANQVLICDPEIPFHKCTKLSKNRYLLEMNEYHENIQHELSRVIGSGFEILSGALVQNGHVHKSTIASKYLKEQDITCIGSYAQCDPLIDIGSVIKRIHNLLKSQKVKQ